MRYYRGIVLLLDFVLVDLGILVHDKRQKHSALIGLRDNTLVVTFSSRLKNTRIVITEPRVICILQGYIQKLKTKDRNCFKIKDREENRLDIVFFLKIANLRYWYMLQAKACLSNVSKQSSFAQ